jgi:arylsulfatase A-like enzyme
MDRFGNIRPSSRARSRIAAAWLVLLCALALIVAEAGAVEAEEPPLNPNSEPPSFVVIQTDDQTLDGLYAAVSTYPGAPKTRVMPNTLDLIGKRGMTFNRYYVPYPLCCPSRVSLLTGRYAHNSGVKGNIQPNGGYFGFSFRAAATHNIATWLQGAGYRTIHVGKFLNGYGDEPYDNGTAVPPGWSAWHTVLKADTHHYFYGYTLNNNGVLSAPYGESGTWEPREYGIRDEYSCPFAPTNWTALLLRDRSPDRSWRLREIAENAGRTAFYLQLDYTQRRTATYAARRGPSRRPATTTGSRGPLLPPRPAPKASRGQRQDKAALHRNGPHLSLNDKHTYRVYLAEAASRACARLTDAVKLIYRHPGRGQPACATPT